MSFLRQSFAHPAFKRQLRPGAVGLRSSRPNSQRSYATDAPGGGGPANNQRLALIAVGLGVPIAFYLFNRSPANQAGAVTSGGGGERGANQEYTKNAEGNQGSSSGSSGPGGHDVPRAMGPPGGTGSISSKQQGLSNSDTMNPYVNESGKSRKGEGEADSAKVKGTVATDRPQK
ncbi:hypothetical protein N7535_001918 [Penicillium sp. DV-2018c]|nr:hypothetical protein N7535_001918 [Penicillium sp. DV-2018c]